MKRSALRAFAAVTCLSTILLFVSPATASAGWTRTYQGEPLDTLTPSSIIQTSDGGYAMAVFAYLRRIDNIGYQGHFAEYYALEVLKTSSNGGAQWIQNFTKIDDPNHQALSIYINTERFVIVQTPDKGYAIASSGATEFWMFKIDSQGKVLWCNTYARNDENPSSSYLYSMILTKDGGFAVTGSTETPEGGKDFWLVKTDSAGIIQWNQTYNSGTYTNTWGDEYPRDDVAKSIIQTNDGGYALAGSASLYRASTSSVVYASWMVKTDAQGKRLWDKGYDLPNDPWGADMIIQTADDGYALIGTQNEDFCLLKISPTGQLQWSKIYGGTGSDNPCSIVQLNDGGYALAGTWTPTNTMRPTIGLLRTDSFGQGLWIKNYTAKENATTFSSDSANAMIRTSDGSYAIVGATQFGSETHQDIFFVKTETLEQPPQITPAPTQSTPASIPTQTPKQTLTPVSSPTQAIKLTSTPNHSPTSTDILAPSVEPTTSSPETTTKPTTEPSPSIPEFSAWIILPLVSIIALLTVIVSKRKKLNQSS